MGEDSIDYFDIKCIPARFSPAFSFFKGHAFQVCDALTWTVLSAWVPHDIEVPRGVYEHSGRLHVEVQPLLLHAFKAVGSCASCKEAVTEPAGNFVASRADSLDLVIHKVCLLIASIIF